VESNSSKWLLLFSFFLSFSHNPVSNLQPIIASFGFYGCDGNRWLVGRRWGRMFFFFSVEWCREGESKVGLKNAYVRHTILI
jgi:hypothetical protein